jgi:phosphoribosylformylglycinamidine synthase
MIGMVGLIDDLDHVTRSTFAKAGHAIVLFGEPTDELGGSEYLSRLHDQVAGAPPRVDLRRERALIDALLDAIRAGHVASAHDCSDGGLAVALAESAIMDAENPFGAEIDLSPWSALPYRAVMFGEAQGRVVVSTSSPDAVIEIARRHGVPARAIGTVRAADEGFSIRVGSRLLEAKVDRLASMYHDAIPLIMNRSVASIAVTEEPFTPVP